MSKEIRDKTILARARARARKNTNFSEMEIVKVYRLP